MSRNTALSAQKAGHSAVSRNVDHPAVAPKLDRRVRRTRDVLGDALVELMHKKPFEDITVQQVLDRAHVGRSTFYTHFRGKDDLFLSDVEDFFEMMASLLSRRGEDSNRLVPVREMFAHVAEWQSFYKALVASGKIQDVTEIAQGYFARSVEERLAKLRPARAMTPTGRAARAHALAGALLSMLTWWIQRGMPVSAEQMDELFHQMVWSGVTAPAAKPASPPAAPPLSVSAAAPRKGAAYRNAAVDRNAAGHR
jgi:AcrR family transcriptional regulator